MLKIDPVHPGEILKDMCLLPIGLNATTLAKKINVSASTLNRIVNGKANISPEMSIKLAKAFDTEAEFWLNLQMTYDIAIASKKVDVSNIETLSKAG